MKFSDIELPSNKKFGFFFTFVFGLAAAYFYVSESLALVCTFTLAALIFLVTSIVRADILLPLNKLWMRFGLLLGIIVSPIVLGVIFFGLFTPISLFMRISGRDELRLKFKNKESHWISRSEQTQAESFKNQF